MLQLILPTRYAFCKGNGSKLRSSYSRLNCTIPRYTLFAHRASAPHAAFLIDCLIKTWGCLGPYATLTLLWGQQPTPERTANLMLLVGVESSCALSQSYHIRPLRPLRMKTFSTCIHSLQWSKGIDLPQRRWTWKANSDDIWYPCISMLRVWMAGREVHLAPAIFAIWRILLI